MQFLESLDQFLFHWVNTTFTNPYFDAFFPAITDLHKTDPFRYFFVPFLLIAVIFFLRMKGLFLTLGLAISLGLSDKIGSIGKHFWQRQRPFETLEVMQRSGAGGYSFPSNHAINMFCMAFFISAFFPKARWPLTLLAFLVAYSRVYNGVHYPLDVMSGGALGAFIGVLGADLTKRAIQKFENRQKVGKREPNG